MTRTEFNTRFAATEANTDWQFTAPQLISINDAAFAAVSEIDAESDIAKSTADHAIQQAMEVA